MDNLEFGRRREDRLPWFPFWLNDWETDEKVRAMGPAARGIYIALLGMQWRQGSIPADVLTILRLIHMPPDPMTNPTHAPNEHLWRIDTESCLEQVLECFPEIGNGRRQNRRLEQVRAEQEEFRQLQSEKGKRGNEVRWSKHRTGIAQGSHGDKLASPQGIAEPSPIIASQSQIQIQIKPKSNSLGDKSPHKRATRLPDNFVPQEEHYQIAKELGINCEMEFQKFRDYFLGVGGSKGVKLDWDATLRNWLRNSINYSRGPDGRNEQLSKKQQRTLNNQKLLASEILGIDVDQDARFGTEDHRVRDGIGRGPNLVKGVLGGDTPGD